MDKMIIILCTCPDEATAERLARGLVEARHAACVNILPGVRSVYRWEDRVEQAREAQMIIKTTAMQFYVIENWMREQHPYDVPELVAIKADQVSDDYLAWLRHSVMM